MHIQSNKIQDNAYFTFGIFRIFYDHWKFSDKLYADIKYICEREIYSKHLKILLS